MDRNDTGTESLDELGRLAREALQAQVRLAKQSLDLGRAALRGEVGRAGAARGYLDALGREGARYWRELGTLGLTYAGDVLALGTRTASRILADTSAAGRQPGSGAGAGPRPQPSPPGSSDTMHDQWASPATGRRVPVTLRGPVGAEATGTATVTNRHPRARRVVLSASELRDAAGGAVDAILVVAPAHVTIASGGEHEVSLSVDLEPGVVRAGDLYTGTVEVTGGDEATLDVTVHVEG